EFVDAVLQEWYKTMSNLPAGLRQAHEMGLVSSAQMVQYLSTFGRPTKARYFSRAFPDFFSRGLVGRYYLKIVGLVISVQHIKFSF
uniref:Uncharacterized protein n=1 Tax=Aegilops tauschii subsp. strangulata TaxID=200361 RepID=A0A453S816_AEGTS